MPHTSTNEGRKISEERRLGTVNRNQYSDSKSNEVSFYSSIPRWNRQFHYAKGDSYPRSDGSRSSMDN